MKGRVQLSEKISTHLGKVNQDNGLSINKISKITLTNHAHERATERFGLKDRAQATGFFREKLRTAGRLGEVIAADGNDAVLYANEGVAIYLSPDLEKVITVCIHNPFKYNPLKDKVQLLYSKELRKISRTEKAQVRRVKHTKAELEIELAELNLRLLRTKSKAVKTSCEARIMAIKNHLHELEKELKGIQDSKRQISKVLTTLVST
jgi:hypothetical protein